ncbi:MAG: hypothetical protein Ta2G_08210 [Termitinemataceae bacterium]|nr:MAG: hypothetical protein Ta2G_08210 [Termitinemataceae bacterium]
MKLNSASVVPAVVSIAILTMIAVLSFKYLEPYKKTKRLKTSSEAQANIFLALDRWLDSTGHKTRIIRSGNVDDVRSADENVVIIFTSSFDFENSSTLLDLIKGGKKVLIFKDKVIKENYYDFTKALNAEMALKKESDKFSSETVYFKKEYRDSKNSIQSRRSDIDDDFGGKFSEPLIKAEGEMRQTKSTVDDDVDSKYAYYNLEYLGNGIITVIGNPYYLQSSELLSIDNDKNSHNIKEAWKHTGDLDSEYKGILFIRCLEAENGTIWKKKSEVTFWKMLTQRGALLPIILPIILLIVIGFWMSLLPFGKLKDEHPLPGKSIRERFRAEGRFYKKYGLLNDTSKN